MRLPGTTLALLALLGCGLIAAGCGGGDDEDRGVPGSIEEAVALCKQAVEASGVGGDAKEQALDRCEQGGENADEALESLPENADPSDLEGLGGGQ